MSYVQFDSRNRGRSNRNGITFGVWLVLAVVGIGLWQLFASLVPEQVAYDTAQGSGYTNVHVTGKDTWFPTLRGCGEGDLVLFNVTATNPAEQEVDFIVCAGLFKGGTVRFN